MHHPALRFVLEQQELVWALKGGRGCPWPAKLFEDVQTAKKQTKKQKQKTSPNKERNKHIIFQKNENKHINRKRNETKRNKKRLLVHLYTGATTLHFNSSRNGVRWYITYLAV